MNSRTGLQDGQGWNKGFNQWRRRLQVSRDKLVSLGSCIGKFTHSDKFRLTIGALDILAAHAKFKVRPPIPAASSVPLAEFTQCTAKAWRMGF